MLDDSGSSNPFSEELTAFARGLAWGSSRDHHEKEDFVQEILIVYLSISIKYSGLPEDEFIALAKTSARNRIRDLIRRKITRSNQKVMSHELMPEVEYFDRESTIDIDEAVDFVYRRVGEKAKAVLLMHRDGLDVNDIRSLMKISYQSYYRKLTTIREVALQKK